MRGAAILAAQAALWSGAGRVSLMFCDGGGPECVAGLPELLRPGLADLERLLPQATVVIGPGLGLTAAAPSCFELACRHARCLVLDADALTLLAIDSGGLRQPAPGQRRLLTPHPGEAARLLGCDSAAIQADRPGSARALAERFQATVVLKGAGSLVAFSDGSVLRNGSGNPGLAAAGMGDTLCGILAALLAQGLGERQAMPLAVWLHGAAADLLVSEGTGPRGITASEVGLAARRLINGHARPPQAPPL